MNSGSEAKSVSNLQNMSAAPGGKIAIAVRHAHKQYVDDVKVFTSGADSNTILRDFNMTVQRKHIYALLGASGCGKTTILRAIMGQLKLTSGEIYVLGQLVGHKRTSNSWVPGVTIGYMPQEISLLNKLTIMETFYYYGQLVGMDNDSIAIETDKLVHLLDIPDKRREVSSLSGGQQRRVSFAVALQHNPPVLILDEPTVGLDAILRESIWHYLEALVQRNGTTVIITTHYIAEATQADTVALMRHGKLLAEQSPSSLMEIFGYQDLEAVFLKLALQQSSKESCITSVADYETREQILLPINESDVASEMERVPCKKVSPWNRVWALMWKEMIWLYRNNIYTSWTILLPILVIFVVSMALGPPAGMHVSVYNQDADCFFEGNQTTDIFDKTFNCTAPTNLSCHVLRDFKENGILTVVASESEESAEDDVRKGRSWAAITFDGNFSSAVIEWIGGTVFDVSDDIVEMGSIRVAMDLSDRVISFSIRDKLRNAILALLSDFDDVCHTLRARKNIPMQFQEPVYGEKPGTSTHRSYVYPSTITTLSFVIPLTAILCAVLPMRLEGILERSMVSGVTMQEIIAAAFLVYLPFVILQIFVTLLIPYKLLNYHFVGSIWISALLLIPIAILGIMMGFFLSMISASESTASSAAFGLFFIFLYTGGLLWPLEGVVSPVRELCYSMPLTYPAQALRHIAERGWTFLHRSIQIAILSEAIWILIFAIILVITLKYHAM